MTFSEKFLRQTKDIIDRIDPASVEGIVKVLRKVRDAEGRLFLLGSGGGAGHSSHAACDFRKLCAIEAYCPTDNVSELTARINDEGWESSLTNYLRASRFNSKDCLFIFSVGGGDAEKNISANLVSAMKFARLIPAAVVGVVGREGGFTAKVADACVVIPTVDTALITPHTEAFQAVIWHLIVSHPELQVHQTKWESTK